MEPQARGPLRWGPGPSCSVPWPCTALPSALQCPPFRMATASIVRTDLRSGHGALVPVPASAPVPLPSPTAPPPLPTPNATPPAPPPPIPRPLASATLPHALATPPQALPPDGQPLPPVPPSLPPAAEPSPVAPGLFESADHMPRRPHFAPPGPLQTPPESAAFPREVPPVVLPPPQVPAPAGSLGGGVPVPPSNTARGPAPYFTVGSAPSSGPAPMLPPGSALSHAPPLSAASSAHHPPNSLPPPPVPHPLLMHPTPAVQSVPNPGPIPPLDVDPASRPLPGPVPGPPPPPAASPAHIPHPCLAPPPPPSLGPGPPSTAFEGLNHSPSQIAASGPLPCSAAPAQPAQTPLPLPHMPQPLGVQPHAVPPASAPHALPSPKHMPDPLHHVPGPPPLAPPNFSPPPDHRPPPGPVQPPACPPAVAPVPNAPRPSTAPLSQAVPLHQSALLPTAEPQVQPNTSTDLTLKPMSQSSPNHNPSGPLHGHPAPEVRPTGTPPPPATIATPPHSTTHASPILSLQNDYSPNLGCLPGIDLLCGSLPTSAPDPSLTQPNLLQPPQSHARFFPHQAGPQPSLTPHTSSRPLLGTDSNPAHSGRVMHTTTVAPVASESQPSPSPSVASIIASAASVKAAFQSLTTAPLDLKPHSDGTAHDTDVCERGSPPASTSLCCTATPHSAEPYPLTSPAPNQTPHCASAPAITSASGSGSARVAASDGLPLVPDDLWSSLHDLSIRFTELQARDAASQNPAKPAGFYATVLDTISQALATPMSPNDASSLSRANEVVVVLKSQWELLTNGVC